MATLFLQPKDLRPETIVLDEPEIGLHPTNLYSECPSTEINSLIISAHHPANPHSKLPPLDKRQSKLNGLIHSYDFVTTLYDFYGFKGLSDNETKQSLEDKIKNKIKKAQRDKIIPYIQMYEFEALLFSDNEKMAKGLNTNKNWIDNVLNEFKDIETINNSKETAPSKRIENNATYIKTQHAPIILQEIGLPKMICL
jgi:hypothetical protein